MDARFYNSDDIDIERLATDLVNVYLAQGYQAQQIGSKDQIMVQLKKGGDFEAIIGMQAALTLTLQRTTGGILAMIGQQRWIDKAAVGAVGIVGFAFLWPLAITAGAGAIRQASLANQALNVVDGLVRQQRPGIMGGPIPSNLLPQVQQHWAPPSAGPTPYYTPPAQIVGDRSPVQQALPAPQFGSQLHCAHCNTPYEPGDTFCSGCGRALATPRVYCSNCNTELKPGLSFCPKCGASTFKSQPGPQSSIPAPAPQKPTYVAPPVQPPTPVYTPPPVQPQTPVYTPPPVQPPTPVYTPPPAPKPQTPVYEPPAYTPPTPQTPAVQPQPQVYYTPSNPQPKVEPPKKKEEPYYVPPTTQDPAVQPQPKVTFVQSTPREEPPPPKAKPQKQYYFPSNAGGDHNQPTLPAEPGINVQPTIPATQAHYAQGSQSSASSSADVQWGTLTLGNGTQLTLRGERVVIGRYDHDLGGVKPEIDLSNAEGADTISRVHAALEYSGGVSTLTDLNSTNATRINGKRLEPDKAMPVNDGDSIQFGKVVTTFRKN